MDYPILLYHVCWLAGWLGGWLTGWLAGWLTGWLGWLDWAGLLGNPNSDHLDATTHPTKSYKKRMPLWRF